MKTIHQEVTPTLYVSATLCDWNECGYYLSTSTYKPSNDEIVLQEIEFPVTVEAGIELTPKFIEGLEKEKAALQESYIVAKKKIDDKIANLLCLEHQPEPVVEEHTYYEADTPSYDHAGEETPIDCSIQAEEVPEGESCTPFAGEEPNPEEEEDGISRA